MSCAIYAIAVCRATNPHAAALLSVIEALFFASLKGAADANVATRTFLEGDTVTRTRSTCHF